MAHCLLEATSVRKNKISLTDYNYQKDIENRILMAEFTDLDLAVLEEILYSSLTIPVTRLIKNLDISKEELLPILEKLSTTGLLSIQADTVTVDKETRKYFEFQLEKFDEEFNPGMDFLQSLLKKPPIHVLPIWYAIPRTSNNIFESLVEKHLKTPQIFQRYILELNFGEPILKEIIDTVYNSENFEVPSKQLMNKYKISRELFEEYMLHLEFSFVCCIGYRKTGDLWEEKVTPFHEWREFLCFLKNTETPSLEDVENIELRRPSEFGFVQDLAILLEEAKKKPIPLEQTKEGFVLPQTKFLEKLLPLFPSLKSDPAFYKPYIHHLIEKLALVRLASTENHQLSATDNANDWLAMRLDNRALHLYRHPRNKPLSDKFCFESYPEKALREAEKSICRVLHKGWVDFNTFFEGIHVALRDDLAITLKKTGKQWEYALPKYSEEDKYFLRSTILEWLFEAGIVQTGSYKGKDCFRVTTLGQTLFAK